jgi:hypothetical protein
MQAHGDDITDFDSEASQVFQPGASISSYLELQVRTWYAQVPQQLHTFSFLTIKAKNP